jgi:hypothetical protein
MLLLLRLLHPPRASQAAACTLAPGDGGAQSGMGGSGGAASWRGGGAAGAARLAQLRDASCLHEPGPELCLERPCLQLLILMLLLACR